MATKGKGKILEGQIAFDFFGEQEIKIKPKELKEKKIYVKTKFEKKKFRKANVNIKHNHFKGSRKVRRIYKKFRKIL